MGIAVVSARCPDGWLAACTPENNGAGGRGRFGLPLYFEEGVPGRGLPLRFTGSYGISDGGGRDDSEEVRERVDRVGELRPGMYGRYDGRLPAVGTSFGAVSKIDGEFGREIEEEDVAEELG